MKHKSFADAENILDKAGLKVVVSDTGYVKSLPPDCILEQTPVAGKIVKSGHVIYLVINSDTPMLTLPDIIDNSSYRTARVKLISMGFKVGEPMYVNGERDWVYGVLCNGKSIVSGQKVSVEDILIIQVGNGMRDASDSVNYIDPIYPEEEDAIDEFEVMDNPDRIIETADHIFVQGYGADYSYPWGELNVKTGEFKQIGNASAWTAHNGMLYLCNSVTDWSTYATTNYFTSYNAKTGSLSETSFLKGAPEELGSTSVYGMSMNEETGHLYIMTTDFVNNGAIYHFDQNMQYVGKIASTGVNPRKVVFVD